MLLLTTREALHTAQTLKIKVVAAICGIDLPTEAVPNDDVRLVSCLTAQGVALVLENVDQVVGPSNAIVRTLARMRQGSRLYGVGSVQESQVDGWLGWIFANIDTPLSVQADKDAKMALQNVIERHLTYQTYIVGDTMTLADVALACALDVAKVDCSSMENVCRWFDTVKNQEGYVLAKSGSSAKTIVRTASKGLCLNGVAPDVSPKLYKRGRMRIKELLGDAKAKIGSVVTVGGWARTLRNANKGQLVFLELNDGSTGDGLQCVFDSETTEGFDQAKNSGGCTLISLLNYAPCTFNPTH